MQNTHVERVAGTLRAEMARHRITQAQLGKHLGLSQMAINRRVSGETALDVGELFAIAEFLEIPVTDILGLEAVA